MLCLNSQMKSMRKEVRIWSTHQSFQIVWAIFTFISSSCREFINSFTGRQRRLLIRFALVINVVKWRKKTLVRNEDINGSQWPEPGNVKKKEEEKRMKGKAQTKILLLLTNHFHQNISFARTIVVIIVPNIIIINDWIIYILFSWREF